MSQAFAPSVVFTVPVFQSISEASTLALQNMAEIIPVATEELGEYFSFVAAEQKAAPDMRLDELVIIPLLAPPEDVLADFTFLAITPLIFVKVTGTTQTFMTNGVYWAYSAGVEAPSINIGTNVKFPSVTSNVVAREGTMESILEIRRISLLGPDRPSP